MVSQKVKQIMKLKKITNVQVAEHLGTSPQALANKLLQFWIFLDVRLPLKQSQMLS